MNNIKVCHLTSVHTINDVRIFVKECASLAANGFDVTLIACGDTAFEDTKNGVKRVSLNVPANNRLQRMIKRTRSVYRKALQVDADIYHFHDPELIPVGLKLIKRGKRVIYDVHEDVPRDILSKEWIIKPIRKIISYCFQYYENRAIKSFSYVLTSTPFIRDRFIPFCEKVIDINNYPLMEEFDSSVNWEEKEQAICYIGAITRVRGIGAVVESMQYSKGKLYLAGTFDYENFRNELKKSKGWSNVVEMGPVDRVAAKEILSKAIAGLVVFWSEPNHVNSQPNKMFEYMSAGIPVIGSNFEFWKTIIEKNGCGICVDPMNPLEIANAINYLLNNPNIAEEMGKRGRNAIESQYNWDCEDKKLFDVYNSFGS